MSMVQSSTSRKGAAVGTLAFCLALALTGCGGGGSSHAKPTASPTKNASGGAQSTGGQPAAAPSPSQTLAQLKGEDGMEVDITSAIRDAGGFVTVQGTITNNGTSPFNATSWTGQEMAVQSSGPSVAGAVLVDETGKKRYYVLRDTEGKCLCTMGLVGIEPKQSVPFFAQFPAPPQSTTQVDFELPTMPPATIQISQG
ncbi:hypothetical protein NGB36_17010 [Streptomyces sp. RB6PN25]|uniref:Secreted protein n=1 Tax=Streptomyces humicola TaxID=2953240 RepID=A0ABT1PX52_9ACTN|nr:hypothetical protein [Streptomyces humicola]MCQ4082261.1 hypothetical protein [Streptomyces humicola]